MSLDSILSRDVVYLSPHSSVIEAANVMRDYQVGVIVVVRDQDPRRRPVGILTDRDIVLNTVAKEVQDPRLLVGDIMTADLLMAQIDDDIWDTMQKMRSRRVRRVPVVDPAGALLGLVTVDKLLEVVAHEMSELIRLIAREPLDKAVA